LLRRISLFLALVGFGSLATSLSFAAHMRQECSHDEDHSTPEAPHSGDQCPVCHGLTASSTALVGGVIVVVAPVRATGAQSHAPIEMPVPRYVEAGAAPRAPPLS